MDLRFKIIADHVQAGWDKAGQSLGALKGKFADFFGGVKGGFGAMAGVVVAAVAGIYKAFEGIRQKWLEEINTMNAASRDFAEQTRDNLRKLKFQDTAIEAARNVDSIAEQISAKKLRLDQLKTADRTESPLASLGDTLAGGIRGAKGLGNMDADQAEMVKIAQEVHFLEIQLSAARRIAEKADAAEVAEARESAIKKVREKEKAAHDQMVSDSLAAQQFLADQEKARINERVRNEEKVGDAKAAQAAKDKAGRDAIKEAVRNARYEAASPEDKRKMDLARLAELGTTFKARDGLGQFAASSEERSAAAVEAIQIRSRMSAEDRAADESRREKAKDSASAKKAAAEIQAPEKPRTNADPNDVFAARKAASEAGRAARGVETERRFASPSERAAARPVADAARKAAAGQSLDLGTLFDRRYGQGVNEDPMLKEAKEQTKTLHQIERKLGMTA